MKTTFKLILILAILILQLSSCKKNCEEVIFDRNVKLTVINPTNSEDISSTLNSNNFRIYQKDIPGQGPFFSMEYGESPIPTIVVSYKCDKSNSQTYSAFYNIEKDNEIKGEIKVDFIKVSNECKDCNFSIDNFQLFEIQGEVIMEEDNNQLILFIEE